VPSPDSIAFYECPSCGRGWAQDPGGPLVERWGGAISLVLYSVIFDRRPQDRAEQEARNVAHLDTERLLAEIELELAEPRQPVREILPGMVATEADLREYLARLAGELRRTSDRRAADQ
jgi:hypothetical protein